MAEITKFRFLNFNIPPTYANGVSANIRNNMLDISFTFELPNEDPLVQKSGEKVIVQSCRVVMPIECFDELIKKYFPLRKLQMDSVEQ